MFSRGFTLVNSKCVYKEERRDALSSISRKVESSSKQRLSLTDRKYNQEPVFFRFKGPLSVIKIKLSWEGHRRSFTRVGLGVTQILEIGISQVTTSLPLVF